MNVDLSDHHLFVSGVPFHVFDWLQDNAPVSYNPTENGDGFWNLVKYHDVVHASRHHEVFSSARGANIEDAHGGWELAMVNIDPPKHTRLRSLVSRGFHPKMISKMEPHIRDIARRIVDGVAAKGECDFVTEVSALLPLTVIAEMIGVPREDHHKIFEWSNTLMAGGAGADAEYGGSLETARAAAMEMWAYWDQLAEKRKVEPADDLTTVLIEAEIDGDRLDNLEFDMFLLLLSVAGNETTRNLISHGMHFLMENPDQRDKLLEDRSLLPNAINEMLRMASPVMHFRRTATKDVELRGQQIKEGDKVVLWYIAANRDPEVFEDPHKFNVSRPTCEHVTFGGGGAHFCLGFSLAEVESRIMFEELLNRLPDMALAGPTSRLASNFVNGMKHMPVKFSPERL